MEETSEEKTSMQPVLTAVKIGMPEPSLIWRIAKR